MSSSRRDFESLDRPMSPSLPNLEEVSPRLPVVPATIINAERSEQPARTAQVDYAQVREEEYARAEERVRNQMNETRSLEALASLRRLEKDFAAKRQKAREDRVLAQLREVEAEARARTADARARAQRRALGFVSPAGPAVGLPINPVLVNQEEQAIVAVAQGEAIDAVEALNNEFANNEEVPPAGNPVANAVLSPLMLARLRLGREPEFTSEEFAALSKRDKEAMSKALAERWGVPVPNTFTAKGYPKRISRHDAWWLAYGSGTFRG